jgi:serine phosphatase RsbU (regulator of sigma subunit)
MIEQQAKVQTESFTKRTITFLKKNLIIKNIILFVTPVSIAVLIFMLFNLSQTVEHLTNSIIQRTTDETVQELNTFFDPAINSLRVAHEWGGASLLETLNPEKLNPQFVPLLKNYTQISSMLIANTNGLEYMLMREDGTWLNRIVSYKGTKQEINRFRWKYDSRMNVLESETWVDTKKYDPRERPWFIGGLKSKENELAWTQPYIFFTTKDPGITVSMNWHSGTEKSSSSVIAFDILLIDISAYTSKLDIGKNGKAFILTSDNKIIGLPKDKRFINSDSLKRFVLSDYSALNIKELTNAVNLWKGKQNTQLPFRFEMEKKNWWAGIHPFKLGTDNTFYIGVVVPEDDFMSEVNRTRTVIIAGFLLVLVLTLLVIRGYNQKQKAFALLEIQNHQIRKQKEEIETKRDEILRQRDKIEEQRNEITDSIKYSRRIQTAVMPPESLIKNLLPEHFVFFRPKDIVSGDFYWVQKSGNLVLWAAVDCTGHGVPGAIMSIIGYNGINRAVREYNLTQPGKILDRLNHIVAETFRQEQTNPDDIVTSEVKIRDGMDIALCAFDNDKMEVEFAAANNSLFIIRSNNKILIVNNEEVQADMRNDINSLYEIRADRQPIGSYANTSTFNNRIIEVTKGDLLYTASDGFTDQFGGPNGKKFMGKQLKTLLLTIQQLSIEEQYNYIDEVFTSWKGSLEQVDDVLIFGVKII